MDKEIILAIVSPVAEHTIAPLIKHVCYPFKYKTNVQNLENELIKLKNEGASVQHMVIEAENNGRVIEDSVKAWLSAVKETTKRVEGKLAQDKEKAKKKCFIGLCPNTITRYKLSKKAEEERSDVTQLLNDKERRCNVISHHIAPMGKGPESVQGYEGFKSRKEIFNKIMGILRVGDVNMIGVYGGGGTGKTTLVNGIARKAMEENLFEEWVMATITQTPNFRNIQGEIADMLGLTLNEESERGRAHRLRQRLKEKNVLVILDDLWEGVDLEAVGIPTKDEVDKDSYKPNKNEQKRCKILLTSRDVNVLSNGMKCENNFAIDVLPFEEAWELFKKMAGDKVEDSSLKTTATAIARKCQGLPVAIVTIASAMKNKSVPEWKDSLRKLESSSSSTIISGLQAPIYNTIKLSYSHLESEELKSTFRLCSLMGRYASIPYLLKYSIGLRLFPEVVEVEAVQDRVYSLVLKLKASCLLLDNDSNRWLAMHDVVRDVAESIACVDHHVLAWIGEVEPKEWSDQDSLKRYTGIWLHCYITELPKELDCPQLQFFHIHSKDPSLKITDNIFRGMHKLRVLDLTNFSLSTLPLSLPSLENLHTLCLDQCALGDIANIGELQTLEVLSFVKSNIKQLPEQLGALTRLRLLDLSDCSDLELIPPNVISKLSLLEELYMGNSFDRWETELSDNHGPRNASLTELKCLSRLTNLEIQIRDAQVMSRDIFPKTLNRYKIFIGDIWDWDAEYKTTRTLKLKLKASTHLEYGVQKLLMSTEDLYLHGLKDVTNIFDKLDSEGFQQLKYLHLQNSPSDIQYIINTIEGNFATAFPVLESLILDKLASLEKICHGKLRAHSFSKLRIVNVKGCPILKNIFSIQVARCLVQLQNIDVVSCENAKVIIAEESEECAGQNEATNEIKFSQLRSLSLRDLPQLRNFCSTPSFETRSEPLTIDARCEEIISDEDKQILVALFNGKVMFPNLEDLNLKGINIEKLWHGQLPNRIVSSFQNLMRMVMVGCPNLKYLFSSSMVKSLRKLKYLRVENCQSMEEIIVMERLEEEEEENISFAGLCILELVYLPKLTQFCMGYRIEFPLLKQLQVDGCDDLKTFVSNFNSAKIVECPGTSLLNEDSKGNSSTRESSSSSIWSCWRKMCPKISRTGKSVETPTTNMTDSKETQEVKSEENQQNTFTIQAALFNEKVAFPSLAEIKISRMHNMEKLWHNQSAEASFSELSSMEISSCPKLVNVFPSVLPRRFQRLEKLGIGSCDSLEEIFDLQGLEGTHHFQLRDLHLYDLPKLKHIWNEDTQGILSFENLRKVSASTCHALENLFPSSVCIKNLGQLEELVIWDCKELKEIVSRNENAKTSDYQKLCFVFPRLTVLKLWRVPKLRNFYPGIHTWECPSLKMLEVYDYGNAKLFAWESSKFHEIHGEGQLDDQLKQPLFFLDKAMPKLEEMSLDGIIDDSASTMWQHHELQPKFFSTLKVLKMFNFKNKLNISPLAIIKRLHNLEEFSVFRYSCLNLKELFLYEQLFDGEEHPDMRRMVSQLRKLEIVEIDGLRYIWAPQQDCRLVAQHLDTLDIRWCHSLVGLSAGGSSVSFDNLTILRVYFCSKLLNLMTAATAKSLEQLLELSVDSCHEVTEIVAKQGGDETIIIFKKLKFLVLQNLKNLTSFCSGNFAFIFPCLEKLIVDRCPKMTIFVPGPLSTPKLRGVHLSYFSTDKVRWVGCLNSTIQRLYRELAGFDSVLFLKLSEFPHLKERWHGQLPVKLFHELRELEVDGCENFSTCIPSNLLPSLRDLSQLRVRNCDSLVAVFDLEGLNVYDIAPSGLLLRLNELNLIDLPRLRHICSKDPQRILKFRNLEKLKVHNCSSLRNIFTPSMALHLDQLKKIEIRSCAMIEEIITKGRTEQAETDMIMFPQLQEIVLKSLPSFVCIYSGTSTLEFPSLGRICLTNSPNCTKKLISSFLKEQETEKVEEGKGQRLGKEVHSRKVPFPNLKKLCVEWTDIMEVIQDDKLQAESCCKLEGLELIKFPKDCIVFPSNVFQKFPNLIKLVISDASFEEIVLHRETNGVGALPLLRELELSKLSKLMHLCKEDSQPCHVIQNLRTLRLSECGSLKVLVPSSVSFQCLVTLEVSKCHGLISLMASSTAKYLVKLSSMAITECEMINEMLLNNENEAETEIIFLKLECLRLHSLPSLTSFCSGNSSFIFPSLKEVYVKECPRLKSFSQGMVSTPKLRGILVPNAEEEKKYGKDEGVEYWQGNINATIYKLFIEKGQEVAQSNLAHSSKQPTFDLETSRVEKNRILSIPLGLRSEHLCKNPGAGKDLPSKTETIIELNKEQRIKSALMDPKTTRLLSTFQDSHASNDEVQAMAQSQSPVSTKQPTTGFENSNVSQDPSLVAETNSESKIEEQVIKGSMMEPEITQLSSTYQDSQATSNDKENPTHVQNSATPMIVEANICLKVQKDPQAINKDQVIPASMIQSTEQSSILSVSPITAVEQSFLSISETPTKRIPPPEVTFGSASQPTSGTQCLPITEIESLFVKAEQWVSLNPTSSSQAESRTHTHADSDESRDLSLENYGHSMDILKKILSKTVAEVARSDDRLLLLSTVKKLKACPVLNSQQVEIVQFYIDNFDGLVSYQPFYEQQIDGPSVLKSSIDDNRKGIGKLKNRYEALSSKKHALGAEKVELKKRLCEIEEEEDHIRKDAENLCAQLVSSTGRLETQMYILPESVREQTEGKDKASNANDSWAKIRSLFA